MDVLLSSVIFVGAAFAHTIADAERVRQEDNAQFLAFDLANRLEAAVEAGGVMVVVSVGKHEMATVIRGEFMQDWDAKLEVYEQLKSARKDKHVKGVILRVNSPGGAVSASDQIHNEILRYREKTNNPVVAFMQSVAASGGYYGSVACDKIIAEPTVITGSIGVIMAHFVIQELLEEKLGIEPVVIKSGERKDWPSPFKPVTDEQKQYLQDKLIGPAYERFVKLVNDGREELSLADVRRLADGSIYGAEEALAEKLIDEIGYLDDAIDLIADLAEIERPHVIEYIKQFSFADFLGAETKPFFSFDRKTLYELSTPQIMYLWTIQQ